MGSSGEDSKIQGSAGKRLPPNAGKGRKKGVPNRITRTVREALEAAFHEAGAEEYLLRQAEANPQAFMGLLAKLLPSEIRAEVSAADASNIIPDGTVFTPKSFPSQEAWNDFFDKVKRQPDTIIIYGGLCRTEDVFPIARRVNRGWVIGGLPNASEMTSYDLNFNEPPEPLPPAS